MKVCSIPGCERRHEARGLCSKHYSAEVKRGGPKYVRPIRLCSVIGCGKKHYAKGFCSAHFNAFRTYGDPEHTHVWPSFNSEGLKNCSKCGVPKKIEDFSKTSTTNRVSSWCKKCLTLQRCDEYSSSPEVRQRRKNGNIQRKYGLTPEAQLALLEKQGGVCAICKLPELERLKKRLAVDHDHRTGKIRGLLCNNCNRSLGLLKDSIATLSAAIEYLKRSDGGLE